MASAGEKALHAALKSGTFERVYLFHGEDDFLKDARTRDLVAAAVDPATRDFNLEMRRAPDLDAEALDSMLSTPPLMAERRVVVVREVDKLKKDARAVLVRYLERPAADTVLILVMPAGTKVDKSLAERSTAVEFAPLTGDRLPKWVRHHVEHDLSRSISDDAVALLIEAVGSDLSQLAVELEKLASYAAERIDEAAVGAVVGVHRGASLGALLDAIGARRAIDATSLIAPVLQQPKTTAVSIVMNLTTQTLAMGYGLGLRARGLPSRALAAEYMTVLRESGSFPGRPWTEAVTAWARNTDLWTVSELDAALSALLLADVSLKDTRLSSDEQLLTSLVLTICSTGSSRRAA